MDSNSIPGSMSDQEGNNNRPRITPKDLKRILGDKDYNDIFGTVPGSGSLSKEKMEEIENMESKPETGISQDDIDALFKDLPKE